MPAHAHASLNADIWSARLLDALEEGEVLVVCRTSASQREVLRRLASSSGRKGWAGLHVSSLAGYVASLLPQKLVYEADDPAQTLPDAHPWAPLLAHRPGLRAELGGVIEQAREAQAAGRDLSSLRPELLSLVRSDWRRTDRAVEALLKRPPPKLKVFSVGYTGMIPPLDEALLRWLDASPLEPSQPGDPLARLDAVQAPDVIAEAREVVRRAKDATGQVLVLVADVATQERLRAALERNGLPVADDGASPLHRHSLAAALEPLLPVFVDPADATIEASDLERLLTEPVLPRKPPKHGIEDVEGIEEPRASVRQVRDLILGCRRVRGTLARWQADLERAETSALEKWRDATEHREPLARRLVTARVVVAQVKALTEHANGQGTLADVARFLKDLGFPHFQDRLGHAVVRTLMNEHASPAHPRAFADALAHTVGSGRIDRGVQLLSYGAYDGRESSLLLLTGVHSKGLIAAPAPSPFLRDQDLAVLGLPTAAQVVEDKLARARWAVSRASTAWAIVTRTDASGRAVTPPVDLPLTYDADSPTSYGLSLPLPDLLDARVFEQDAPPNTDSLQVDAEWARAGARFTDTPAAEKSEEEAITLLDHLADVDARFPERLKPWLGETGQRADGTDALPDGSRVSASKMEAFTQCLYRAYLQQVLRVEERDEPVEDLDVREIGIAVHGVLEEMRGVKLLTPSASLASVRKKTLRKMEGKTATKVEEVVALREVASESEALKVARQSLAGRWEAHLGGYVDTRIEALEDVLQGQRKKALKQLEGTPSFQEAMDALAAGLAKSPAVQLRKNLVAALIRTGGVFKALSADELGSELAAKNQQVVASALKDADTRKLLRALCDEARELLADLDFAQDGDLEVVAIEKEIGRRDAPLTVPLEGATLKLHGRIDALARRQGEEGSAEAHRVIDFKTGRRPPKPEELVASLLKPQLALYGLALEAEDPPLTIDSLEIDQVGVSKRTLAPFTEAEKEHARRTFGGLLALGRQGRFPLAPHPDGCPHLGRAYCDYQEICRLRAATGPDTEEEA